VASLLSNPHQLAWAVLSVPAFTCAICAACSGEVACAKSTRGAACGAAWQAVAATQIPNVTNNDDFTNSPDVAPGVLPTGLLCCRFLRDERFSLLLDVGGNIQIIVAEELQRTKEYSVVENIA